MRTTLLVVVDVERRAPDDTDLAHLARHQRRVRGGPAELGEEPLGRRHTLDVLGDVSWRTSRSCAPGSAVLRSWASAANSTTSPVAAPGPALVPVGHHPALFCARRPSPRGSNTGRSRSFRPSGSTRAIASSGVISPSSTMSTAILTAAKPVRLPLRVCSIQSFLSSMVNSKSCMSR